MHTMFSENQSTVFHQKHLIQTVKHSGGEVIWSCFVDTVTETVLNTTLYQNIHETNVKQSVQQLKLGQNWVMQQNNDPKNTRKLKVLEQPI